MCHVFWVLEEWNSEGKKLAFDALSFVRCFFSESTGYCTGLWMDPTRDDVSVYGIYGQVSTREGLSGIFRKLSICTVP